LYGPKSAAEKKSYYDAQSAANKQMLNERKAAYKYAKDAYTKMMADPSKFTPEEQQAIIENFKNTGSAYAEMYSAYVNGLTEEFDAAIDAIFENA
jgi:hypothetical protein